ncbi:ABC transporter substrate-binding protein [Demequina sp.]|uniref:ABC transporter substrate-binding protein n=1 Tax=Demequina sp. TaxID=2050685 RepID=UPI003D0F2876
MARWNTIARGSAVAAVAALALAACSTSDEPGTSGSPAPGGDGDGSALTIGTLLPQTGSLAFLGPPEIAGVDLAIKDINEAGGVNGQDVSVVHTDSSDADNPTVASTSVDKLISDGVGAIIGAASSTVSLNVVDTIAAASIVQISPANTSTALSGYSPFYFRVAPPDTIQGNVMGKLLLADGKKNISILVFNDDYGTSLRDVVQETVEPEGATITYGKAGQEFDPKETDFDTIVANALEGNPDALLIIAFDQTKGIVPKVIEAGYPATNIYMVDGNTADYSKDFDPGVLEGAKGTIPGAFPAEDFQERLNSVAPEPLTSFAYGPESYDSAILVALAAQKAGATDGASIQANMAAVSGATGGEECSTYADCLALLNEGKEIAYKTIAGSGAFNDDNDPSSAFIGIYTFDGNNVPVWQSAEEGVVQ